MGGWFVCELFVCALLPFGSKVASVGFGGHEIIQCSNSPIKPKRSITEVGLVVTIRKNFSDLKFF